MGKKNNDSSTESSSHRQNGKDGVTNKKNGSIKSSSDSCGVNEIESLFSEKKRQAKQEKNEALSVAKRKRQKSEQPTRKQGNRSLVEENFSSGKKSSSAWVDDGLGGKFNPEGYTGRVQEGMKIFKAHVLNKPNFGSTKDCPFDCDCCYI